MSKCSAGRHVAEVGVDEPAETDPTGTPTAAARSAGRRRPPRRARPALSTGSANRSACDASSTITTSKGGAGELLDRPVDRHDPDRHGLDRRRHGRCACACQGAALRPVPLPILRRAVVQSASAAFRRSSRVRATSSQARATTSSGVSRRIFSRALDPPAEHRRVDAADHLVEPGLRLPPLPGAGRAGRRRRGLAGLD